MDVVNNKYTHAKIHKYVLHFFPGNLGFRGGWALRSVDLLDLRHSPHPQPRPTQAMTKESLGPLCDAEEDLGEYRNNSDLESEWIQSSIFTDNQMVFNGVQWYGSN